MRFKIVIAGNDRALNRTRTQLLKSRYDVTAIRVKEFQRIESVKADLLIVCHSVPIHAAAAMIESAAEQRIARQILWLSEWQTIPGLLVSGQSVIQINSQRQPWLAEVEKAMEKIRTAAPVVNVALLRERSVKVKSSYR